MTDTHYIIRAKQVLTMPNSPDALPQYEADCDIFQRDAEILGLIEDGAVIVNEDKIEWVGTFSDLKKMKGIDKLTLIETNLLMPGLVDCHTHSVFSGNRSGEFALRNAGRTYLQIMEAGGGILNTVDEVRRSSTKELTTGLVSRVFDSVRRGVTTLEVKSGYGLTTPDERKMLRAIENARPSCPCELVSCFLGAHAFPREFKDNPGGYVDRICNEMIPLVAEEHLATHCDVFCDKGAFSYEDAKRVLSVGIDHGLLPRIHADELTDAGAAKLACELGCTSADHLECTPPSLFPELAKAGVTPVIMPGVNLFLGTTSHAADARGMIAAGCDVAIASDCNPGSAMTQDMQLMTTLACTIHKLTPGESLRGVTVAAAKALGRCDIGRIEPGMTANLSMFDVEDYRTIPYHFGENHVSGVVYNGDIVYWTEIEED